MDSIGGQARVDVRARDKVLGTQFKTSFVTQELQNHEQKIIFILSKSKQNVSFL